MIAAPLTPARTVRALAAAILALCLAVAFLAALHWPLRGDETLMRYAVWSMQHGAVAYRTLWDVNLPGTYAIEWLRQHTLGDSTLAWRAYDSLLLLLAAAAYALLLGRRQWFAALLAAGSLALIHLADGVAETGQRDLLIAALLLLSLVPLVRWLRGDRSPLALFSFGLAQGATLTVKPVLAPELLLLLAAIAVLAHRRQRTLPALGSACAGLVLPPIAGVAWLLAIGSLGAFAHNALPLIRLHGELGRRSLGFLLAHAVSPLGLVLGLTLAIFALRRRPPDATDTLFLLALAGAVLGYVLQGKGFTYQRYPQLALVLLLVARTFDHALEAKGYLRLCAVAGIAALCLWLAPQSAWLTRSSSGANPFDDALQSELTRIAPRVSLQRNVQCLDTYGGCIATLGEMGVMQSTGFLYDCYLFSGDGPEEQRYRAAFLPAFTAADPRIVVMTDEDCFIAHDNFTRLARWPELQSILASKYDLRTQWRTDQPLHWWKRREEPTGFRIYVRR